MKTEEFDVQIMLADGDPIIVGMTPTGKEFVTHFQEWYTVEEFLAAVPPGLRVGLLNPETNLFAQLPPRSLH